MGGFTWRERFASLPPALPIVAVVVIIIFFVYNPFGDAWGTPTEGGAVGAFIVFLMALYRGMRWGQLKERAAGDSKTDRDDLHDHLGRADLCAVPGLCRTARCLCRLDHVAEMSPLLILVCILLAYAVLGMFMDAIGMLLLTLPVVYPAVMALNGARVRHRRCQHLWDVGARCARSGSGFWW